MSVPIKVPQHSDPRATDDALIQSEKLSALGRMVAAIAHEINNPLTTILGQIQLLLASPPELSADLRHRLTVVSEEAFRAARIVNNLLTFAQHSPPERRPCSMVDQLQWVLTLAEAHLEQNGIEVVTDFGQCPTIWVDENQIRQVLLNLVQNAEQAMTDAPDPRVLTLRLGEASGRVQLEVIDSGPGIAPAVLPRIFDPFFTTKPTGTGLGLWVSLTIVEQHGGQLTAENHPGGGAAFVVSLPYRKRAY
jgi:signal transduction histidine kinase